MSLMLRLQIGAILISLGTNAWLFRALAGHVPDSAWRASLACVTAFNLWWLGSILWRRLRRPLPDTPDLWFGHTLAVFWLGNLTTAISFWLMLPSASPAVQMLAVFFTTGPVAVEAMGSVRPPRFGPRGAWAAWAPVGIPAAEIGYFAVHGGALALPVILFWPALLSVLLLLRENLQRSLTRSHQLQLEAERARDARTRFLAAASHDLGQPLQSARLFLDQALRSPDDARRARANENARDALEAMERLLRTMLDQLRLGAGAIRTQPREFMAAELIGSVAAQFQPLASLAKVELIAMPSTRIICVDRDLMERALGNLVDNALRHAQARRVLIGLRMSGPHARFWVIDDGVGVAADDRSALFDEYVQGAGAGAGERGGFGLGLASVRRIAKLLGGDAYHDPGWRGGSAFCIDLPRGGMGSAA